MSVKWGLLTNAPDGCEWGTLWRDADRRIPWITAPQPIDPPKPRRNNGPVNLKRLPAWILSKALRWT